ncbi:lipopolysaccharide transport system permease protein [Ochrobactrum sp. RC6B]|uniref:Transport permease protein n=1 Tax=Brucella intermedia TaxID=94625 RepID=A0ABR6AWJ1_9HYPH|nr:MULTISPECIES: ABC transporter permease [Brucella/Ochrobactrum group]MBA8842460.1 lipopolysaccharide transport system permease protein [Ochrobactrum sp. RH1CCR137]MBA8853797.1 lipopolysaccharide transport system permease protein [Brucella intermedia]MBA8854353.1 lipopolysaccharide transport system permease protein [Ochrobactrum sp. RH1CCR134]MBB3215627.1 lipopolysaccharide transport system permease protein [Ochrobactrum sp. RC6B]MCO7739293.1 ABC transporter permease [Brucella intermedia]
MSIEISGARVSHDVVAAEPTKGPKVAIGDIVEALSKYRLALIFGWQDVAQRYRRSRVGAFWLTLNMAVFIGALGLIFGTLFQSEMREFLPYLCAGIITWGFISTAIGEGCTTFTSSEGIILQVRMPLFTHILRTIWRNIIIFAHNIVIFPILFVILGRMLNLNVLWAFPGFLVICVNLAWITLILAVLCARFRDMTQVVANVLQVMFYATPIMWMVKILPDHVSRAFIEWNPFFHLIELVRAPLLGTAPTMLDWGFTIALAIVGWTIAIVFFGRYRWRVAYWL